jgi:hypothetical protein
MLGMGALSDQLYGIYTARIYSVLAHNDPVYQQSLAKAGLGWTAPAVVPPAHRESFEQEMKLQAWLATTRILDARSLDPSTVRAKVLDGPLTLYRVSQSGAPAPPGIWWFTGKIAQRCRDEAGSDRQEQLDYLRNVLAVCFNWSRFDWIQRLSLRAGESIPAVLGRGLPMPYHKADPYINRKTGQLVIDLPPDYWKKKGEILIGGELQVVLPWIPVYRIAPTDSL